MKYFSLSGAATDNHSNSSSHSLIPVCSVDRQNIVKMASCNSVVPSCNWRATNTGSLLKEAVILLPDGAKILHNFPRSSTREMHRQRSSETYLLSAASVMYEIHVEHCSRRHFASYSNDTIPEVYLRSKCHFRWP